MNFFTKISCTSAFILFSNIIISQNIHPNNRVSAILGGPTAYIGLQYEHFFALSKQTSISSGLGIGGVYDYYNFSIPLMYNTSFSVERRLGVGFSYTHFPKASSNSEYEDLDVQDVFFLNLEYNYLPLDSRWEWTIGLNPLYEFKNNLFYLWGGLKLSYVFETEFKITSPFRFKKRYKLRTS